jgi:diguanylate cyclase (GGDEF)-like protein
MLHEVALLVHAQLREYDFLARYAGDEFVAILPDVPPEHVEELRERIERAVSGFSIEVRGQGQARVGISVGSSLYGADGETLDQLLIAADRAMYRAKSTHKASIFAAGELPSTVSEQSPRSSLITRAVN